MTGRKMNEYWGKVHFWGSLIFMNIIFMPMFIQGFAGLSRRMSDGGATYSLVQNPDVTSGALSELIIRLNEYITLGAFGMLLIQVVFVVNFFHSIRNGEKVENDNPVEATTLDWQTPHLRLTETLQRNPRFTENLCLQCPGSGQGLHSTNGPKPAENRVI